MYGIIYKITNLINGKIYIGQTRKTLKHRLHQHFECARRYYKNKKHLNRFQRAIIKYGKDGFKTEIIDTAESKIELNAKEKYWINFYNSINEEYGYNRTAGGDGGPTTNKCRWYNDGVKNYYIHLDDEVPPDLIKGRLNSWSSECNKGKVWINNGQENKCICIKDLDKYPDYKLGMLYRGDAWKENLSKIAKNRSEETRKKLSESQKRFHQEHPGYRNKGNWVKGQIGHNRGKISITNGTKNKFINEDELSQYEQLGWYRGNTQHREHIIRERKAVYCFETDKIYKSVNEAAKELGLIAERIMTVARGAANTTKGYHFKYVERGADNEYKR